MIFFFSGAAVWSVSHIILTPSKACIYPDKSNWIQCLNHGMFWTFLVCLFSFYYIPLFTWKAPWYYLVFWRCTVEILWYTYLDLQCEFHAVWIWSCSIMMYIKMPWYYYSIYPGKHDLAKCTMLILHNCFLDILLCKFCGILWSTLDYRANIIYYTGKLILLFMSDALNWSKVF